MENVEVNGLLWQKDRGRQQQNQQQTAEEMGKRSSRLSSWDSKSTLLLLVGCLTSQQHASVSQGQICSDSCTCCHTEVEVADQVFYIMQSECTDMGQPVSALTLSWQACDRAATCVPVFTLVVWLGPEKSPQRLGIEPSSAALKADTKKAVPRQEKNLFY